MSRIDNAKEDEEEDDEDEDESDNMSTSINGCPNRL